MSTLQADPSALNEFFNKTAEKLVGQNATTDDVILSHIYSLLSSHDSFKLQQVTCNDARKSLKITTKWLLNFTWQHPSFFHQIDSQIHCLTITNHNQQFNLKNRNFRINGKMLVSVQYRKLPTQQSWGIIVQYRFFRFCLKCTKNRFYIK